jgi:hypothetical protein
LTKTELEESPDMDNWAEVTNQSDWTLANLQEQIMVPAPNGAGFFRLATP